MALRFGPSCLVMLSLALLTATHASAAESESESESEPESESGRVPPYFPVNAALVSPIATNFSRPNLWTSVDLAILLSRVGFVDGIQLGPVGWIRHNLRGVQIGAVSAVGGTVRGWQLGAGFSWADKGLSGVQTAGVINWAPRVRGLQLAGVANQVTGRLDGIQGAGLFNVLRGEDLEGIQFAGGINIGRVDGLQIAPINVSQRSKGLQIGVINVAAKIDGLQIGVINITRDLEGESLGILPLPREGGIHLSVWGSNTLFGNVGIKFASRFAYTIWSFGVGREERDVGSPQTVLAPGLTMGAAFPIGDDGVKLAGDLGAYRRFREELTLDGHDELFKLRAVLSYALAPRMAPFIGAGGHLSLRDDPIDHQTEGSFGPEIFLGVEL